jgi:hypothetical protein
MQARTSIVKEQEQTIVFNLSNGEELAVSPSSAYLQQKK